MRRAWERWYGTALHPRWLDGLYWWLHWRRPVTRRMLADDMELTEDGLKRQIAMLEVFVAATDCQRRRGEVPEWLSPRAAAMFAEAQRRADQAREPLTAVKGGGMRSVPRRPALHLVAEVDR